MTKFEIRLALKRLCTGYGFGDNALDLNYLTLFTENDCSNSFADWLVSLNIKNVDELKQILKQYKENYDKTIKEKQDREYHYALKTNDFDEINRLKQQGYRPKYS